MTEVELKQKRDHLGLTQRALGELLDLTSQQISNYESGRMPIPKIVEMALDYLGQKVAQKKGKTLPLSNKESDFVHQFVAKLKEGLGDKIILTLLFGSKVRGEARRESDLDLLVLLKTKKPRDRKKIFEILFAMDPYNPYNVAPVIYSLKDFQMNEKLRSPFIANIKSEGILL